MMPQAGIVQMQPMQPMMQIQSMAPAMPMANASAIMCSQSTAGQEQSQVTIVSAPAPSPAAVAACSGTSMAMSMPEATSCVMPTATDALHTAPPADDSFSGLDGDNVGSGGLGTGHEQAFGGGGDQA